MSVEALAVVLNHSRAKGTARLVLMGIANHEGEGGSFPSKERLARYANVHVSNIPDAIRKLVELGEVEVILQGGRLADSEQRLLPKRYQPNLYLIKVRCPDECDRSSQHRMPGDRNYPQAADSGVPLAVPLALSTGVPLAANQGYRFSDSGVPLAVPKPSFEPSEEPGGETSVRKETRARARAESPPTPEPPPNPEPAPPPPPASDTAGIPPRRCPEHIRTLGPVPACGACKEARLLAEQWEAAHPVSAANARNADTATKHPACPDCHAPAPAGHCARCARNHSVATPSTVHALRAALPGRQRRPAGRRRECHHGRPVAWLDAAGTVEACPDCRRGVPGPENATESRAAATG